MNIKIILISLFILIFSLPFLVSFLYSVSSLCEAVGCGMCGVIGHHIEKWLDSFLVIAVFELVLILIVYFLKIYFKKEFANFVSYIKNKITLSDSILINPIKRLCVETKINPRVYF